ncbi:MAG: prolyl oligopeptidase family serine peptidase [Vicinamibacterales bacterium]
MAVLPACAPPRHETSRAPAPPATRTVDVVDTIHGETFADPYRWLEDQGAPETRRWIDAQNAYGEQVLGRPPLRAALETRLRALMDRPDIGTPQAGGDFEYFTLRRAGEELPVLYRRAVTRPARGAAGAPGSVTPPRAPVDPAGTYEVVVDPTPMSADGTTRVELVAVEPQGRFLVYGVRDGGQDEFAMRIRDLASGRDLDDGFPPALYSSIVVLEDGSGFYYSRRSRQTGARIHVHRWNTDPAQDPMLFGAGYGPTAFVTVQQGAHGRALAFVVQHGWARSEVFVQRVDGTSAVGARPVVRVTPDGAPARFYPRFVGDELWMRTDLDASNNRLVAVDLAHPTPDRWRTIVPEGDDVLEEFAVVDDRIYATYLHDASARIAVFEKDGTKVGSLEVPEFHNATIRGGGGSATLTLESFAVPETRWRLSLAPARSAPGTPIETAPRTLEEATGVPWDGSAVVVHQEWAVSKDGTKVPLFVVHRRDVKATGDRPTLLTGYGGFYAASRPSFSPAAAAWVEMGGVFALANMRGGSEFGEAWHRAGMLTGKPRVFDDFIAAAEWLVANKYTNPNRLAITGVSNGGLLVGAALTKRPDLFRAVMCGFPDVDILRFNAYTTVNNMPALLEYGDAAIREQFDVIKEYSPYQRVQPKTAYPAVMVMSGDLDTRVPPLAARKFTARLQAASSSGRPIILRYHPKAGHANNRGLPFSRRVEDAAAELTFLATQVEWAAAPAGPK